MLFPISVTNILLFLLSVTVSGATITTATHNRHLLHQPLFATKTFPPVQNPTASASSPQHHHHHQAPTIAPQPQPTIIPKYPFTVSTTTPPTTTEKPFFPTLPSPPPSPSPPSPTAAATFPANISSILFPHQPSSLSHGHIVAISVSASLLFAAVIVAVSALLVYSRNVKRHVTTTTTAGNDKASHSEDSSRLFPPNTTPSDKAPVYTSPHVSSEFLYLGTLVNSRGEIEQQQQQENPSVASFNYNVAANSSIGSGSPELRPLSPLPRLNYDSYKSGETEVKLLNANDRSEGGELLDDENDEFFSPRGSSVRSPKQSSSRRDLIGGEQFGGSRSFNSRTASYPYSITCSPADSIPSSHQSPLNVAKSPDSVVRFPAPPVMARSRSSISSIGSDDDSPDRISVGSLQTKQCIEIESNGIKFPPPPPPRPPPMPVVGPPVLVLPSRPILSQNLVNEQLSVEREDDDTPLKPKLKPLHWDKVRASSDRVMVWDQIKSSSFQVNEEMIETLFMVNNNNNSNLNSKDNARFQILPIPNQENRVLDPKKSQNIAILLRALNVTNDEVCEALLEGNSDTLGTELLESLLKMAPTSEEERRLKEFKDESPFKLGPAEKFLKAVLEIPFAFKRIGAMLYIANFDSEVDYLRRSFEILQSACEELKNSRMFLKLLEAVLKTGNRMNVGTNRGDAHAFKLDTLLKLVDVKGTDGKTTLLHFVVQEIIKAEGSRISTDSQIPTTQQSTYHDDVEYKKLGLQVVSGLSGELTNVKKSAAMDSDVFITDVARLATGISKLTEVVKLNEDLNSSQKFRESVNGFLKKAEEEIGIIQNQQKSAFSLVKEITEYFHDSSVIENAHPFRIFMVVRDFLSILDQVCKEVGKMNERTLYATVRPMPVMPIVSQAFPIFNVRLQVESSDDESSSSY